jgi:hypothetical protein
LTIYKKATTTKDARVLDEAVLEEEDRDEWAQLEVLDLELDLEVVLKEEDQLEAHQ